MIKKDIVFGYQTSDQCSHETALLSRNFIA